MGCDYYLIKQLEITFTYKNIEYRTIYVLTKESKYYLEYDIDSVDSDDENYYEYLDKRREKEREQYHKKIIIHKNNNYINQLCKERYDDDVIETILKEIDKPDVNLNNILINKIEKVLFTQTR